MIPPGSGFSPAGSSGGHGVGSLVPNRTRTAVAGLNRYALPAPAPPRLGRLPERRQVVENPEASAMRAGDEIGAEARAVVLHLDVAHRDRRHVVLAATASDRRRRTTPRPAGRSRRRAAPSARILANRVRHAARRDAGVDLGPRLPAVVRAPEVRIHVVDPHRVRRGVRGERCRSGPASMLKMRVHGLIAGGVTFVHFAPPSVVTWMLPSSVPAQITLWLRGDSESAVMLPSGDGVTVLAYLPAFAGTSHVWRARSGLMRVQRVRVVGRFPHHVRRVVERRVVDRRPEDRHRAHVPPEALPRADRCSAPRSSSDRSCGCRATRSCARCRTPGRDPSGPAPRCRTPGCSPGASRGT